jgi:hypothetical protein
MVIRKGYNTMNQDGYYGWWVADEPTKNHSEECHCGTRITMGKDDAPRFHSDFCPVYQAWVAKGKPDETPKKK